MATVKLNTTIRDLILRDVIGDKYVEAHKALMPRRADLALQLYKRKFTSAQRKKMEALPDGWLPTINEINCVIGDGSHNYRSILFSGFSRDTTQSYSKLGKPEHVYMRTLSKVHYPTVRLEDTDKLAEAIVALEAEEQALVDEEKRIRSEAHAVLNSVTTANRLIQAWPEIRHIVDKHAVATYTNVPAKLLHDLNETLNLPLEG